MIERIIEKWTTPAGLVIVLGLVIWLVQLNANAIQNAEEIGALKSQQSDQHAAQQEMALILQRTMAIQESIMEQLDELQKRQENFEIWYYQNGNRTPHGSQ